MEYFSSLDYNPYATSNLSTHKWYMIFPTQLVVNNHTQEFWFINFSNDGYFTDANMRHSSASMS